MAGVNQVTARAIEGARAGKVSKRQVKLLICNAQLVWKAHPELHYAYDSFEVWRKEFIGEWGYCSFKEVDQLRFVPMMNRLRFLANKRPFRKDGLQFAYAHGYSVEQADDRRRALGKLEAFFEDSGEVFGGEACARNYAESLFSRIYRTDSAHATAKQIWQVYFTLNNRARRKQATPAAVGGGADR